MYFFRVKDTVKIFLLILILQSIAFSQLKKLSAPNMVSPVDIYLDNGNRYSTLITLKFKTFAINLPKGETKISIDKITFSDVKNFIKVLIKKYGSIEIEKAIPSAMWGDTIRINKRTGKSVFIKDMSQIFKLKFSNLVPVDSIADALENISEIEYAQGPVPAYLVASPNDPYYQDSNYRWSFDVIDAELAWDITKGSSNISVSMNDQFGSLSTIHEDLIGKVVYRYNSSASGGHGTVTAGVVGALANNNLDIASLGWNTSVMFNAWGNSNADQISDAIAHGADIINFSWVGGYYSPMSDAIHNALIQGVVCVAAAGNNILSPIPGVRYPAAYNFGSDGQVIAVSGTELDNGTEQFITSYNYSPGTDPINDPTNAFIDCSAPGTNYRALSDVATTGTVHIFAGTSISSPFVSALVGLVLSVNDNITPPQIYEIITQSAEKIGNHSYDGNGWNRYLGYGRINAYKALKYTLEHYGGTLTQNITIPSSETWNFQPGITLTFNNGSSLIVNGTLEAEGTSSNKVTFDFISPNASTQNGIKINNGGNADISYAIIKNAYRGIYVDEAAAEVDNCEIKDCSYGIYLYRTNYGPSQPNITNVHSHDNGTSGITLYYSSPDVLNSEFDNSHYGMYCNSYSSPRLGYAGTYGNNNIHNNFWGLFAYINSNPFLGRETCTIQGGNNKIQNNGPDDIRAISNCTVIAEENYWGNNPPSASQFYADATSSIDYTPWLVSSPFKMVPNRSKSPEEYVFNNAFGNLATIDTTKPNSFDPSWKIFWKLLYARNLVDVGKYKFAQEICKDIINEYPDSSLSFYALDLLWKASQKDDEDSFKSYLREIKSKKVTKDLYGSAEIILLGYENTGRISNLDNLASQYSSRSVGETALFSKFLYYINEQKNIETARAVSKELDDKFPDSPAAVDAHMQLGDKVKDMIISKSGNVEKLLSSDEMPKEYSLLGNYPNPFNPSTKIRYTLPFKF